MVAIDTCYNKKIERYAQKKFEYCPKSNLLKLLLHKSHHLLSLEKLDPKQLYNISINTKNKPTSQNTMKICFHTKISIGISYTYSQDQLLMIPNDKHSNTKD